MGYYQAHQEHMREYSRQYYWTHREQRREYRCSEKGKAVYAKHNKTEKGKATQARYKKSEKGKAVNAKHSKTEKGKATFARYYIKHKTARIKYAQEYRKTPNGKASMACVRAKRRAAMTIECTLTAEEWQTIIKAQESKCHYCHKKLVASEITMDHFIPLSKGGHHIAENIVAACRSCNSSKGSKVPTKYQEFQIRKRL